MRYGVDNGLKNRRKRKLPRQCLFRLKHPFISYYGYRTDSIVSYTRNEGNYPSDYPWRDKSPAPMPGSQRAGDKQSALPPIHFRAVITIACCVPDRREKDKPAHGGARQQPCSFHHCIYLHFKSVT